MNSFVIGLIRTYSPIAVGALLTWLASSLKIVVDPSSEAALVALCVAVLSAAYYFVARLLEKVSPVFGVLLGVPAQPAYPAVAAVTAPKPVEAAVNVSSSDPGQQ